jgi:FkbM family methyltransferase
MKISIYIYKILKRVPFFRYLNVKILQGNLKGCKWGLNVSTFECLTGNYEPETETVFIKHINKNNIVYDIGANVGYFTLLASNLIGKNGKVYSFEPLKKNIAILSKHIKLNSALNVTIYDFAISDINKQITFTDSENTSANTYIHSSSMFKLSPTTQVQARSLDDLIYNNKLLPPDFIKIDIEGAEFDALKGAEKLIKKYQPIIYISTHENHLKGVEESCKNFLSNLNYDVTLLSINNITPGIKDYIAKPKYEKA